MAQERIAFNRFHSRCLRCREQDGVSSRCREVRWYPLNWLWSVKLPLLHPYFPIQHPFTASSAYEDTEWINKLVGYVSDLTRSSPEVKLFGTSDRKLISGSSFSLITLPRYLFWSPDHRKSVRRDVRPQLSMGGWHHRDATYRDWPTHIWRKVIGPS